MNSDAIVTFDGKAAMGKGIKTVGDFIGPFGGLALLGQSKIFLIRKPDFRSSMYPEIGELEEPFNLIISIIMTECHGC